MFYKRLCDVAKQKPGISDCKSLCEKLQQKQEVKCLLVAAILWIIIKCLFKVLVVVHHKYNT